MEWVKAENERALAAIAGPTGKPEDDPMFAKLRAIYDDKKKIPNVRLRGDFVYNFWQDEHHVKGIWRRTTMDDFKTPEPTWETVLDVDALAAAEGKSWVWKGPQFLDYGPGDDADRVDRCVVNLSDGARTRAPCASSTSSPRRSWTDRTPSCSRRGRTASAGSIATSRGSATISEPARCRPRGTR